ncbi:hypothetical protein [Bacillus sp. FSL K6-1003]
MKKLLTAILLLMGIIIYLVVKSANRNSICLNFTITIKTLSAFIGIS